MNKQFSYEKEKSERQIDKEGERKYFNLLNMRNVFIDKFISYSYVGLKQAAV